MYTCCRLIHLRRFRPSVSAVSIFGIRAFLSFFFVLSLNFVTRYHVKYTHVTKFNESSAYKIRKDGEISARHDLPCLIAIIPSARQRRTSRVRTTQYVRTAKSRCSGEISRMPFKFDPQPIPQDYTFNGKNHHLTYPGFISKSDLLATAGRATTVPLEGWSACHEDTSFVGEDGVEVEGYKHTHFCMMFKARIKVTGSRAFDIRIPDDNGFPDQIHPNIQPGVTAAHCETIFADYHAGRKYSVEAGKFVFKAPVWRDFKLPPLFEFQRAIMQEMINAPTLQEACIAGQVRPRTVNDVKTLRDDSAAAPKIFKHLFDRSTFVDLHLRPWTHLHIWGPTGIGKTKWACAQGANPCLIKPFNSVGCLEAIRKQFNPQVHDLLVLDEADLRFMTRETAIGFLDFDEDCTLSVRFTSFTLSAGVRKILISNPEAKTLYPEDKSGAIDRRLTVRHVTHRLYTTSATPAAATQPAPAAQPIALTPATQQAVPAAIAAWQAPGASP